MTIGRTYKLLLHGEEEPKMYKLIKKERGFLIFIDIETGKEIISRLSSFEKIDEGR